MSARMTYDLRAGHVLAHKYEVVSHVRGGQEGELYVLSECATGIERAAKFFFPHCNPKNRTANTYAKKLHKLRHCDILMQYRTQETVSLHGLPVTFLVSDFPRGRLLREFLASQPGARLSTFEALHLLHALARGVEQVHQAGESLGRLDLDNVMIRRKGLGFEVKLLDLRAAPAAAGHAKPDVIRSDVFDLVRIFHEAIGGARAYPKEPACVKAICCGLRRPAIEERFRDAGMLRRHLETMQWS